MTMMDPGYSEAAATLFIWVTDKMLGGVKKAFGGVWTKVEWAKAQDRYDSEVIKQHGMMRIFGQTIPKPLRAIYSDVRVFDEPTAHQYFGAAAIEKHIWNEDRGLPFRYDGRRSGVSLIDNGRNRHFFILGKPGSGKTTFLKFLALREAHRGQWHRCLGKVPIFVPLREYAKDSRTIIEYIVDRFAPCHFPGDASPFVRALLASGQAIVLFDGLDEVSKTEEHDRRGAVFAELMDFARIYSYCHIVVTCRIAAMSATPSDSFIYAEMADFMPNQVAQYVHSWFWDENAPEKSEQLAAQMLSELQEPAHAGMRDLGRSPLLLTLLCLHYGSTMTFPTQSVELYRYALDYLLRQWDRSQQIERGSLYKRLSLGRKQQMFVQLAFDTFSRNEIIFSQHRLESWLLEYLSNMPDLPEAFEADARLVLEEIVAQHGILAEQANGLYSFAHLTFQEYYVAMYFVEHGPANSFQHLLEHVRDHKWHEVFRMTVGLLSNATIFLGEFATAITRIAASNRFATLLLRDLAQRASKSQTVYNHTAIRLLLLDQFFRKANLYHLPSSALNLASFRIDPTLERDFRFAEYLDQNFEWSLAVARKLSGMHHTVLEQELKRISELGRARSELRKGVLHICKTQSRKDLHDALFAVQAPSRIADQHEWEQYSSALLAVIDASGELAEQRKLRIEVTKYKEATASLLATYVEADANILNQYAEATMLYYRCIQDASEINKRDLEQRILESIP